MTLGLFVAWAVHDAEELVAIPGWVEGARPRLERRFPSVPDRLWRTLSTDRAHTAVAIGLMGGLIAAAFAAGERTDGSSSFFQAVLTGFAAHAVVPHLASALVTGGYTPGLLTAPTVVAPFSWWAWRELDRAGIERVVIPTAALAIVPLAIGTAHIGAAAAIAIARRPGQ